MKTAAIALLAIAIGFGAGRAQTPVPSARPDPAKIEAGKTAYTTQKCATCHSIKGVGAKTTVGPALDTIGTRMTAADIKKWLTVPAEMEAKLAKKPVMSMAAFLKTHKLTAADVDALVAYMQTLK